jgi:hypothetical protein
MLTISRNLKGDSFLKFVFRKAPTLSFIRGFFGFFSNIRSTKGSTLHLGDTPHPIQREFDYHLAGAPSLQNSAEAKAKILMRVWECHSKDVVLLMKFEMESPTVNCLSLEVSLGE